MLEFKVKMTQTALIQAKPQKDSIRKSCMNVLFFYEAVYEGFLQHTIQRAKPQATRHQFWVLTAEELRHGKSHWGGRSPERSPLEQGMMGT